MANYDKPKKKKKKSETLKKLKKEGPKVTKGDDVAGTWMGNPEDDDDKKA
jgi:hypothetical protein